MNFLARTGGVAVATCVAILFVKCAAAATIISHNGSTDPTTESPAWTLSANGTGTAGSGTTHLGEPAWKMTDPIGDLNGAKYSYASISTAQFDDPTGWTVEWRMAAENLKDGTGDDEAGIQILDGHFVFGLILRVNGPGAGDGATLKNRFGNVTLKSDIPTIAPRATGFHDFALDFDPNTNLYRLYFEGALVTDSNTTPALIGTPTSAAVLRWGGFDGNNNDPRDVDSYWNSVQFRTGVVPEPSSLILSGISLSGLAVLVFRRQQYWRNSAALAG